MLPDCLNTSVNTLNPMLINLVANKVSRRYHWVNTQTNKNLASNEYLTLFDMGDIMAPQNVFDHCAQTLRRRKLKLSDV